MINFTIMRLNRKPNPSRISYHEVFLYELQHPATRTRDVLNGTVNDLMRDAMNNTVKKVGKAIISRGNPSSRWTQLPENVAECSGLRTNGSTYSQRLNNFQPKSFRGTTRFPQTHMLDKQYLGRRPEYSRDSTVGAKNQKSTFNTVASNKVRNFKVCYL